MTTTLLLDLDDTLLDTNMDDFVPVYFRALSKALEKDVASDVMLPALIAGTRMMLANDDPATTLMQAFDRHFFPAVGIPKEILGVSIDRYYEETFPSLEAVISTRPDAVAFANWALESGYRLAIATNPVFPLRAIQHRLRWAGLPVEEFPFALVSSYETFHFTKSLPAYFIEVVATMGWPDGPVIMIGNDINMDLVPAAQAGLPTFWINYGGDAVADDEIPHGGFSDLMAWLGTLDQSSALPMFTTTTSILATLRAIPAALSSLIQAVPARSLLSRPHVGEWCLTEILCHFRDVEAEVNLPRVRQVLTQENPFMPGVVSDDWVITRKYAQQDGLDALARFIQSRKELLRWISAPEFVWDRPTRHAIFGPTNIQEIIKFICEHDKAHIQQAWKTIQSLGD